MWYEVPMVGLASWSELVRTSMYTVMRFVFPVDIVDGDDGAG